jgi:rubrerythrin
MTDQVAGLLRAARVAEKQQTLFYRALSSVAEERGDSSEIEALNGLLADEQHHLSRLTVRMLELNQETPALEVEAPATNYDAWREAARERERAEIARYESLLRESLDEETAAIVAAILETERAHERHLGGKYTEA